MSFSGQNNNIPGLSVADRVPDRVFPVGNCHISTAGRLQPCHDILNNRPGFFIPRIIRSDNRKIGEPAAHFSHLETAGAGPLPSAAKQAYQPAGIILTKCLQKTLKGHGVVSIIDHQCKIIADSDHLDPALHMDPSESSTDIIFRHIKMTADGNRAQRVVDTETAGSRHMRMNRNCTRGIKLHTQLAGRMDQRNILRPQIIFFTQTIRLHLTGVPLQDPVAIGIIPVDDSDPAL